MTDTLDIAEKGIEGDPPFDANGDDNGGHNYDGSLTPLNSPAPESNPAAEDQDEDVQVEDHIRKKS